MWVEQYRGCGCSQTARYKQDLPGYCPTHGTDLLVRYHLGKKKLKTYRERDNGTTESQQGRQQEDR